MHALLLSLPLAFLPLAPAQDDDPPSVRERFEAHDDAGELDAIVELWRENPGEVLYTIDSYLEGALAVWEQEGEPEPGAIEALHRRALRGALAADEAFGRGIFTDYASSFVGWTDEQKRQFRAGQAAYGAARDARRAGDAEGQLASARRCVELAEPLGDWWGTAMGLTATGMALEELGESEGALRAHSRARLLHQQLGLFGSEMRNLMAMARLATELDRRERARVCVGKALALAASLDAGAETRLSLLQLRATLEERDGDLEAQRATLQEILSLREELEAGAGADR